MIGVFYGLIILLIFVIIFVILIGLIHEFGHFITARKLAQKPIAMGFSMWIFASVVIREKRGGEREEKIIALAGPVSSLIGLVLIGFSPLIELWILPNISYWIFVGLLVILVHGLRDLKDFYVEVVGSEPEEGVVGWIMNIVDFLFKKERGSWNLALIFSRGKWEKWKKKSSKEFPEIDLKEIYIDDLKRRLGF